MNVKKVLNSLVLVFLLVLGVLCLPPVRTQMEKAFYPCKYSALVEQYAAEYDLDPLLVYSFIRTESGFDPAATSSVNARGLMQMTEETFLWMRSKLAAGENVTFDDLYDPAVSLRYGCYYLHLCLQRYNGDVATAAAAYHSGWGTVDTLLQMEEHSADGDSPWGKHLTMTCIIFIFMSVFMKSQTGMKKYPLCVIKPILQ